MIEKKTKYQILACAMRFVVNYRSVSLSLYDMSAHTFEALVAGAYIALKMIWGLALVVVVSASVRYLLLYHRRGVVPLIWR
jgi:hypothetical protein